MPPDRIQLNHAALLESLGDRWPAAEVEAAIQLLATSEGKFPAGARRLPVDLVKAIQRERLIAAMLDAAATLGYRETNVQDVIERAGVSRPTFYEHFANKEDCFLTAFDASASRLRARVSKAAVDGEGWRQRLRLGLEALLAFTFEEPQTARALIVEARAGSPEATMRRVALLDGWASHLEEEAHELLAAPPKSSSITAAAVVGGIEAVLYARLCRGELAALPELLPSLMYFAVLPYEGQAAAAEELGGG